MNEEKELSPEVKEMIAKLEEIIVRIAELEKERDEAIAYLEKQKAKYDKSGI